MHSATRYAMAWSLTLAMIAAVGCGSDAEQGAETESDPENQQPADPGDGTSALTPPERSTGSGVPSRSSKPRVSIETSLGNITVELLERGKADNTAKADNTVTNFLDYVRAGHYDNTIFHEVMKDYVVIGGSFTTDLKEKKAGFVINNEARTGLSNVRGTIAMSRQPDDKRSATCQFFFNLTDNSGILDHKESPTGETTDQDYGYCAFGTVIAGMEVIDAIGSEAVEARGDFEMIPVKTVLIQSMKEL